MTNFKGNRAALVNSIEKFVHAHGHSYVSLEDVDLIEDLTSRGVPAIAPSSRDDAQDRVFRAACWALENAKIIDQYPRICHHGDYTRPGSALTGAAAPSILQIGIEQFNGKTPRDDAVLMILALKVLASHGCKDYQIRIGNVDILAQMLTSYPYIVKHEVLRDLEELSEIDDRIHLIESGSDKDTKLGATGESIPEWCTRLAHKTEQEFGVRLSWNKQGNAAADIKKLFKEIKSHYVQDKWHETCGVSVDVGESFVDLLNLKWLPFDVARRHLVERADGVSPLQQTIEELRETVEDLQTLYLNGAPESQIVLDPCLSHGLGYYTGVLFKIVLLRDAKHGPQWLCRGGRYDSLVADLAQRVGAVADFDQRIDEKADILASGFAIHVSAIAEGWKEMTPSGDGAPRFTPWIRSVNVITPPALRREAEGLADRLRRESSGLAVVVYESVAAVKQPEHATHELSVSLGHDWKPEEVFEVFRGVPGGERSWRLDERRLKSFLDADSRCGLRGGPGE
jgi:histidyl-tRNA synthetase